MKECKWQTNKSKCDGMKWSRASCEQTNGSSRDFSAERLAAEPTGDVASGAAARRGYFHIKGAPRGAVSAALRQQLPPEGENRHLNSAKWSLPTSDTVAPFLTSCPDIEQQTRGWGRGGRAPVPPVRVVSCLPPISYYGFIVDFAEIKKDIFEKNKVVITITCLVNWTLNFRHYFRKVTI